mgnify:CR=1 FL=1
MACPGKIGTRRSRRQPPRAGFSLFELTCALFVITTGIFGVIQLYTLGLDKTKAANEYAIARTAIDNEIETLRALPFDELKNGRTESFRSRTPALEKLVNAKGIVVITDRTGDTRGLKQVEVILRWKGEYGRLIEKSMTTLISKKR